MPGCDRLILGVGVAERGDDGAGPALVRAIRARAGGTAVETRALSGEATEVLTAIAGRRCVTLVDAMRSGAPPGTVRRFDAAREPLPASLGGASSHGLGVAEAIELARVLGDLPDEIEVFGIEAESCAVGAPLSVPVAAAVERLAARLGGGAVSARRARRDRGESVRGSRAGRGGS